MADDDERYDPETVRRIVTRALRTRASSEAMDGEALRALASELGIDHAALRRAIDEERAEAGRVALARRRAGRAQALAVVHLVVYAVTAVALAAFARRIAVVLLVAWGAACVLHVLRAFRDPRR